MRKGTRFPHRPLPFLVGAVHKMIVVRRIRVRACCIRVYLPVIQIIVCDASPTNRPVLAFTVQSTSALVNAISELTTRMKSLSVAISY
jgi:hypothetical protein